MSDEDALLAAITAHPDDDTPRLVYADWLQEHGHPERAEFIRAQCRYFRASATQSDYTELRDRCFDARARAAVWLESRVLKVPPGFAYSEGSYPDEHLLRRGFFYRLRGDWLPASGRAPDEIVDRVCAGLEELVATTTVRALELPDVTAEQLERILAAPGAERLTGLTVGPIWQETGDEHARVLGAAHSVRRLTELVMHFIVSGRGARALAAAQFDRLERCTLPGLLCTAGVCTELAAAPWFRHLKEVRAELIGSAAQPALLAALSRLPNLEELIYSVESTGGLEEFARPTGFPELGYLALKGTFGTRAVEPCTRGPFPRLLSLTTYGLRASAFRKVVASPWFARLQVFDAHEAGLTNRSICALARSQAAANLRAITLANSPLGPDGLALLGDGSVFPSLVTLALDRYRKPRVNSGDLRRFLAGLSLPRLSDLDLDGWPLDAAAAAALASNPALGGLIYLCINGCGVTDRGFRAIVRSPHLHQLTFLGADFNRITNLSALFDPGALPGLRELFLYDNRIALRTAARLRAAREWFLGVSDE
jgi:uncharacterized protein (TIGR02996 family)